VGFIEKTRFGSKTATPAALNEGLQTFYVQRRFVWEPTLKNEKTYVTASPVLHTICFALLSNTSNQPRVSMPIENPLLLPFCY
jgi:hypothetical protein